MTTELKIEGMSCGHCVRSVTEALKAVPGVAAATVTLEDGKAIVDVEGASPEQLIAAVEQEGYRARRA